MYYFHLLLLNSRKWYAKKQVNFMKSLPYYDDLTARQTIKLRELIKTLPPFAKEFFRAIDSTTQVRTRIAYAYDLRVFFHFLIDENPAYRN